MPLNKKHHSQEEIDFLMGIGPRIAAARSNAKYSQQKVAELLNCSANHISDIETGNATFTLFEFKKMCNLYGIDASDILEGGVGYSFIKGTEKMTATQKSMIGSLLYDFNLLLEETNKRC